MRKQSVFKKSKILIGFAVALMILIQAFGVNRAGGLRKTFAEEVDEITLPTATETPAEPEGIEEETPETPAATPEPEQTDPTETPTPEPTETPALEAIATATPEPTITTTPEPTITPEPINTQTPIHTSTYPRDQQPTAAPIHTPTPQPSPINEVSLPEDGAPPLAAAELPSPSAAPIPMVVVGNAIESESDLSDADGAAILKDFFNKSLPNADLAAKCGAALDQMSPEMVSELYIAWREGKNDLAQFIAGQFKPANTASKPAVDLNFERKPKSDDATVVAADGSKTISMFADQYGKYRVDLNFNIQNDTDTAQRVDLLLLQDKLWSSADVGFDYISAFDVRCESKVFDASQISMQQMGDSVFLMLNPGAEAPVLEPGAKTELRVSYWLQAKMSPVSGVINAKTSVETKGSVILSGAETQPFVFKNPNVSIPAQCRLADVNPYSTFIKGSEQTMQARVAIKKNGRKLSELNAANAAESGLSNIPSAWLDVRTVLGNYKPVASVQTDGAPVEYIAAEADILDNSAESSINLEWTLPIDAELIQGEILLEPIHAGAEELTTSFVIAGVTSGLKVNLKGVQGFNNSMPEGTFDVMIALANGQTVHVPFQLDKQNGYLDSRTYALPKDAAGEIVLGVYAPYGFETSGSKITLTHTDEQLNALSQAYYQEHKEYDPDGFAAFIEDKLKDTPSVTEVNLTVKSVEKTWIMDWSFLGAIHLPALSERRLGI